VVKRVWIFTFQFKARGPSQIVSSHLERTVIVAFCISILWSLWVLREIKSGKQTPNVDQIMANIGSMVVRG
jgi:hypothetical protein